MGYNIENRKRTKNHIYYFTSHEHAISNILNNRIKLSNFNTVNDIYELRAFDSESEEEIYNITVGQRITQIKDAMGFVSFSKFWDSPLMWGHYASNTGICLGYKPSEDVTLREINYDDKKIPVSDIHSSKDKDDKLNIIFKFFYQKSSDWEYEQELRLLSSFEYRDIETGLYFYNTSNKLELKEIIIAPN